MGTTSDKLTYLNTTKSNLKDMINYGLDNNNKITNQTTFRNYVSSTFKAFIESLNNPNTLWGNLPKITGEGKEITLNNTIEAPMRIELNSSELEQGADPSPTNPQQIHTISGDNEIVVQNKNLFKVEPKTLNGITLSINSEGEIVLNGTASGTPVFESTISEISSQHTLSFTSNQTITSNQVYLRTRTSDGTLVDSLNINSTSGKVTSSSTCAKTEIRVSSGTTLNNYIIKPMLELGSTATSYIEYKEQVKHINLGSLEYCEIGDYKDEFYLATDNDTELVSGKWYIKKNIGKVVLDGSEDEGWELYNSTSIRTAAYITVNNIKDYTINDATYPPKLLSSHFISISQNDTWLPGNISMRYQDNERVYFCFDSSYTDTNSIKNWFSNNNTTLYYVLATPTYTILNDTLQTQLEDIYNTMKSYNGQTSISQINNDLGFTINVSALEDIIG